MKITTWNVAGLRAMIRKNGWAWLSSYDPDVICLQEVKANPDQMTEEEHAFFSPYTLCWNSAERKGYSGTLTLVKDHPVTLSTGLGIDRFDREERTIRADFDDFTQRGVADTYFSLKQGDLLAVSEEVVVTGRNPFDPLPYASRTYPSRPANWLRI